MWKWQLVAFQKDALWDTSIFNSWFNNVDGIIIEVVKDDTFTNSEILIPVLNDWFLEVSMEFKNLNSK